MLSENLQTLTFQPYHHYANTAYDPIYDNPIQLYTYNSSYKGNISYNTAKHISSATKLTTI